MKLTRGAFAAAVLVYVAACGILVNWLFSIYLRENPVLRSFGKLLTDHSFGSQIDPTLTPLGLRFDSTLMPN